MQVVYSPRYNIDIGTHVFPTAKYGRLAERLLGAGLVAPAAVHEPEPASWADLALVHTPDYLHRLQHGGFQIAELAQLEVPWSAECVEGFRVMTGGTILAARLAIQGKKRPGLFSTDHDRKRDPVSFSVVAHLGGGTHHAFPDHGEGFCYFNDVAVAIRVLQRDGLAARAAVVDLDVHHGNGTAVIFAADPRVFTLSLHQQFNYPVQKPPGSLDVGLPDGTRDAAYDEALAAALPPVFAHQPEILFYLAGADPYEDDQLGGLALTKAGLRARDRRVLAAARDHAVPVVICLAGGYARRLDDTVDIHFGTIEEATRLT